MPEQRPSALGGMAELKYPVRRPCGKKRVVHADVEHLPLRQACAALPRRIVPTCWSTLSLFLRRMNPHMNLRPSSIGLCEAHQLFVERRVQDGSLSLGSARSPVPAMLRCTWASRAIRSTVSESTSRVLDVER